MPRQTLSFHGHPANVAAYGNACFNSGAVFEGRVLLAREDGLYFLDFTQETSEQTGVILPKSYLGRQLHKRIRKLRFYGVGSPEIQIIVDGESSEIVELNEDGVGYPSRQMQGRTFEFRIAGFDVLDLLDAYVNHLSR